MKLFGCSHIFCTSFNLGKRSLRAACYLEPSLILLSSYLYACVAFRAGFCLLLCSFFLNEETVLTNLDDSLWYNSRCNKTGTKMKSGAEEENTLPSTEARLFIVWYCLAKKKQNKLTDILAKWTKTTTCGAQHKLRYTSREEKRGLMMGMMVEQYWISDAKGKSDGPFLLVFLPSQHFTTQHWTRWLFFLDRGPDSPLPREARRTLLDKLIPCI